MCRQGKTSQEVTVRTSYSSLRSHHRSRCCDDEDDHSSSYDYTRRRPATPTYGTYIYTRSRSPSPPPPQYGYSCATHCHYSDERASRSLCHRRGSGGSSDRVVIEVRRRHEPSFNIRVSGRTRPEDVIAQLAPDHCRDEIVVHWRAGGHETLRSSMAMDSVVSKARYFEIKNTSKTRYRYF